MAFDKFFFVKKAWDVWTVAKFKDVDVGVAYDMLRTDIMNGTAKEFNTDAALPGYDWTGLKAAFDAYTREEQIAAYSAWHNFQRKNYTALCAAWVAKDKAEFQSIIDAYVAQ